MAREEEMGKLGKDFMKDLHVLAGFSFPLKCRHCGRSYANIEQFLEETQATDNLNGIMEGYGFHTGRIVEVLRRCVCGELLVEEFEDRRDQSPDGVEHRLAFSRLVIELRRTGMTRDEAHASLRRLTAGFNSEQLNSIEVL